jgi:arginine/lysine/ornithine decarboxylase
MRKLLQKRTPLFDTLYNHAKRRVISFHTPGHKNGRGVDPRLKRVTGKNVYYFDVTVFPEVDSLHAPTSVIKEAQRIFADAYGVKNAFFLVNGSTVGNQIMLTSACKPGDSVILSRICHKSVLSGIILSGVWPIWIQPRIYKEFNILLEASPEQVKDAVNKFPEAKAVFVTSPTYNGITTDLVKISEIVHSKSKLLLVDEAHGPHLKFHSDFPISAVEAGADLCVQSIHKILSAFSQGSVLYYNSELLDLAKLKKIVSLFQTTSPNYLILASLDLARAQVVREGEKIFSRIIEYVEEATGRINRLQHFRALTREEVKKLGYDLDVTKITINVSDTGYTGYEISEMLNKEYNIQVDCSDMFNIIAIVGIGTTKQDLTHLVKALESIDKRCHPKRISNLPELPNLSTEMVMNPRDVVLSSKVKRIPLKKSAGHISVEAITPYPPGIPILIPGERITEEIRDYLIELSQYNVKLTGHESEGLKTIQVVSL